MYRLSLFVSVIFLFSCSRSYTYNIQMEEKGGLNYSDDTMDISFNFDPKFIYFELFNKSTEGIKINWDEVSISEGGNAKRVLHKETNSYNINDVQPPTTVPPKSRLKDAFIPSDNVKHVMSGGRRVVRIIQSRPSTDYGRKKYREKILAQKGERISIYLPYYVRNEFRSKTFDFVIKDVVSK